MVLAKRVLGSALVFVAFIAAWWLVPGLLEIPRFILPTPPEVVKEFWLALREGNLLGHTWITFVEIVLGFFLGSLLGIVIGYALSFSRTLEVMISPYVLALQISPKIAFAPLFILWFGFGIFPKVLTAILVVFFPIMINVLVSVRFVDYDLIQLMRSFKANRWQIFWTVEFPSSLPALFSGLRIGATLAVIGVVVGELVGANIGLGYLLVVGEGQALTGLVLVTIIMLTILGILFYLAVVAVEKVVLSWHAPAQAEGVSVPVVTP
jgi:NitT/TauT family transport system permease protein